MATMPHGCSEMWESAVHLAAVPRGPLGAYA